MGCNDPNREFDGTMCTCKQGFSYVSNIGCIKCPFPCTVCYQDNGSNAIKCGKCAEGHFMVNGNCISATTDVRGVTEDTNSEYWECSVGCI